MTGEKADGEIPGKQNKGKDESPEKSSLSLNKAVQMGREILSKTVSVKGKRKDTAAGCYADPAPLLCATYLGTEGKCILKHLEHFNTF